MLSIRYTKLAVSDLNNSYEYISHDNPAAARSVIAKIEITLSKLAEFPHIGHPGRVDETYEFVVTGTPFTIVYMYDETALKIISILHSSRRYP